MKHWKKGLCGLLAAVLMVPAGLAAPVSGGEKLSGLEGLVGFGGALGSEGGRSRSCIWMGGRLPRWEF